MLDGPAAFAVGCSLYAFIRAARERSGTWLTASAGTLGLAVITKETALVVLPAVAIAAALEPRVRLGFRAWLLAAASFAAVVSAALVAVLLGGGLESTLAYLRYQLGRHEASPPLTYVHLIEPYFGWPFVALVVVGIVAALRRGGDRRTIAIWVIVPAAILQAWGLRELQAPMSRRCPGGAPCGDRDRGHRERALVGPRKSGDRAGTAGRDGLGGSRGTPGRGRPDTRTAHTSGDSVVRRPAPQSGLKEASMWLREHAGSRDGVLVSTAYKSSVVGYYSDRPANGNLPAGNPTRSIVTRATSGPSFEPAASGGWCSTTTAGCGRRSRRAIAACTIGSFACSPTRAMSSPTWSRGHRLIAGWRRSVC